MTTKGTPWREFSDGDGSCVQVRRDDDGFIRIRDSKLGDESEELVFTAREFQFFEEGAATGFFADLTRDL